MTRARITYRFDQDRSANPARKSAGPIQADKVIPLLQEEFQVIEDRVHPNEDHKSDGDMEFTKLESLFDAHSLNSYETDFGSWRTPFETESERVERIIKETSRTSSPRSDQAEPLPGAQSSRKAPEQDADHWSAWTPSSTYGGARYAKSSGAQWLRVATSIAGAVVTGIAFGFFVLSMFSGNHDNDPAGAANTSKSAVSATSAGAKPEASAAARETAAAGNTEKAAAVSASVNSTAASAVAIAGKSYSFLQSGVFSTLQSAEAAQAGLKKAGLASVLEQQDKVTVFAGFATGRDEALAISQQLKDKKIDVFIKTVEIPAVANIRWGGSKPEAVGTYITQGDKLVKMIGGLTIVHLMETKPSALEAASLQSIRSAHQAISTVSAGLNDGTSESAKTILQKMNTALNSTVQSMEEYQKNPSTAMLWQTQSSLMQYILSQKEFLQAIAG